MPWLSCSVVPFEFEWGNSVKMQNKRKHIKWLWNRKKRITARYEYCTTQNKTNETHRNGRNRKMNPEYSATFPLLRASLSLSSCSFLLYSACNKQQHNTCHADHALFAVLCIKLNIGRYFPLWSANYSMHIVL